MIRQLIPHALVNTLWHLPRALAANLKYGFPSKKLNVIGVTGSDGKTTTTTGIYHLLKTAKKSVSMISTVNAVIGNEKLDTGFHVTTPDPWLLQKLIKKIVKRNSSPYEGGAREGHLKNSINNSNNRTMEQWNNNYLVLESTSHALTQHRLYGINFQIGVVTNITHEHLDYHGNYQNYLRAKAKLFNHVKLAVLNMDDNSYQPLLKYLKTYNPNAAIYTYGIQKGGILPLGKRELEGVTAKNSNNLHISASQVKPTSTGAKFILQVSNNITKKQYNNLNIAVPLPGKYNISNSLAVIAVGLYLKIPPKAIQKALNTFPEIPGRMEEIKWKKRQIIIDFAHTPAALQAALETLKSQNDHKRNSPPFKGGARGGHLKTKNSSTKIRPRLISVFGCAGLRDTAKRPMMGKISAQLADITILTAEDPRTEDVNRIINQIAAGCKAGGATELGSPSLPKRGTTPSPFLPRRGKGGLKNNKTIKLHDYMTTLPQFPIYIRIPDRAQAISTAIAISRPHDTIGIFGKGHEQSMCYGATEHPWSDRQTVKKAIKL